MVEVLRKENAVFGSFDILTDNEVREGLKKLSNWPTFPQLYVQGKLVGGLDVAKELQAEGELAALLPAESKRADLNERLAKLVRQQRVMVFIKGTPQQPRCGFSAQMLELLRHYDVEFGHFDVLEDDAVRQGLKAFSNFPTFPQLYVDGKLVGGLDICAELHREAELELILAPPKPEAAAANAAE
jgi:Grx4 family monothiol glutaredoxin